MPRSGAQGPTASTATTRWIVFSANTLSLVMDDKHCSWKELPRRLQDCGQNNYNDYGQNNYNGLVWGDLRGYYPSTC